MSVPEGLAIHAQVLDSRAAPAEESWDGLLSAWVLEHCSGFTIVL
ncbi:MAG: hypothetical protein ACRD1O_11225 [Terriglobia bacterium]